MREIEIKPSKTCDMCDWKLLDLKAEKNYYKK